jgi:hypothetical protein
MPKAGDSGPKPKPGGSGSSSSASEDGGGVGTPGRTPFAVLVDVACHEDDCTIDKYYKNLEYDDNTLIVYWLDTGSEITTSGS